jgi:two-component system, NtrC family, sensor histidine kinase PilS
MKPLISKHTDNESVDAAKVRRLNLLSILRVVLGFIVLILLIGRFNALSDNGAAYQSIVFAAIYTVVSLIGWRILNIKLLIWRSILFAQLMIDIILISLLVVSLGGSDGGYAMLYAIPIITATTLLSRPLAFFVGAISVIVLMLDAFRRFITLNQSVDWLLLGLYGIACFVCIALLRLATERADQNENLIRQASIAAMLVQEVQEQHLPDDSLAWVVFDNEGTVHLLNKGARSLAWQANVLLEIGYKIVQDSPLWPWYNARHTLEEQLIGWPPVLIDSSIEPFSRLNHDNQLLYIKPSVLPQLPHMTALNLELESTRLSREHQSQLAAMGRISASIAHEIRNPLGAISQAVELLQENDALSGGDRQLIALMLQNTQRINRIISNLLLWSRGIQTNPSSFLPNSYLADLVQQLMRDLSIPNTRIVFQGLDFTQPSLNQYIHHQASFDTDHLYQILSNLLSNALRHARQDDGSIALALYPRGKYLAVSVMDNGEPVAASVAAHLFEPFQSTAKQGTGLGLYLSREYAVANKGVLQLFEGTQLLRLLSSEYSTQLFKINHQPSTVCHPLSYTKAFVLSVPWSPSSILK